MAQTGTGKITMGWANDDKTIVLCTYFEGWGWEDAFKALEQQHSLIESSPAPVVDVIIDSRNSSWLPRGGSLLSGIRKLNSTQHPRQGHTMIVGARGMIASIADVMMKLIGQRRREFHFAKTMEDAYRLIDKLRVDREKEKAARSA